MSRCFVGVKGRMNIYNALSITAASTVAIVFDRYFPSINILFEVE